ncbi:hypothetical protein CXB51_008487 [Gossypium anomalum]|uniref:Reverse transcriptase Ty1/copia-type domain-containing protein n=1 Tax=Gossypium anomalum TaxID=47600 RepID=A0A8J5ZSR2_9ROSI|nr:hypothetical protein CXB51_008487 [Gossypium anomalum]
MNPDGSVNRYKARLVVKGFSQLYGLDFTETFAPVARLDTIRLLLTLAAQKGWRIHQMDVKSTFLNGFLKEEISVEQPQWFAIPRCVAKQQQTSDCFQGSDARQKGFTIKILRRYRMENCKPASIPITQVEKLISNEDVEQVDKTSYKSLEGCLLYLTASKPDIMFTIVIELDPLKTWRVLQVISLL